MRQYKGPIFQHRHYAAIAKVMSSLQNDTPLSELWRDTMSTKLAEMFLQDNPNFNRPRFFAAVRGEPTNGKDVR